MRPLLAAGLASLLWSAPASAQSVVGTLLETASEKPILLGTVVLMDTTGAVVARTYSDHEGRFELNAPGPGSFLVAATRPGYGTRVDGVLELGRNGYIEVAFYLKPEAIPLNPIIVEGEREAALERGHLENAGFYERFNKGFGYFTTPEMITKRPARTFRDLFTLRPVPMMRVFDSPQGTLIQFDDRKGGFCDPAVYVDGGLRRYDTTIGGLEMVTDVHDVAAVEVYTRPSSAPLEYGSNLDGTSCAVVLIWTRK